MWQDVYDGFVLRGALCLAGIDVVLIEILWFDVLFVLCLCYVVLCCVTNGSDVAD